MLKTVVTGTATFVAGGVLALTALSWTGEANLKTVEDAAKDYQGKTIALVDKYEALQVSFEKLESDLADKGSENKELVAEVDRLTAELNKANESVTKLEGQLGAETEGKNHLKSELDKANTEITEANTDVSNHKDSMVELLDEEDFKDIFDAEEGTE